jgi:hypothetical protein
VVIVKIANPNNCERLLTLRRVLHMKKALGTRETHPGAWKLRRFCGWLCGLESQALSLIEAPISESLPEGVTIRDATAGQLGEALKLALTTANHEPDAMVKFVFSQFAGSEVAKAEVVIRTVIPVIPAEAVYRFVQTAARARPSLALTVAKTVTAMVPDQSEHIAKALESVLAGGALQLFQATQDSRL